MDGAKQVGRWNAGLADLPEQTMVSIGVCLANGCEQEEQKDRQ